MEYEIRIIDGEFYEGETVTVEMIETGKQYTRKVKYSARKWADLYITIDGMAYTLEDVE